LRGERDVRRSAEDREGVGALEESEQVMYSEHPEGSPLIEQ
jgi:hypothetical protein